MGNFKQGNPIGKHVIIQVNGDIIQTEFWFHWFNFNYQLLNNY
jgi:hypothetical protein